MGKTMRAKDALSSKLAEAYVTVDGNRYLLFQAKSAKAKVKKNKTKVAILGRTSEGNKANGWSGTFELTIYQNTDLFYDMIERYKNTGEDIYFDLQMINNDPSSDAGRKTTILRDCNLDEVTLAQFDADGDNLEQDVSGTFEDFDSPEKFKILAGMQ